jgi:hypothetical protein
MRDPERIKPFLETLEKCWMRMPDWRFGQLISNFQLQVNQDLFYIEDDVMEKLLKGYCKFEESR